MSEKKAEQKAAELRSYYVRKRNAMAVFGCMGPVWEDNDLHLMQVGERIEPELRRLLQEALTGLTLHLMARPRNEVSAWTVNFREPPLNLFVTGDSLLGTVVGRLFMEGVKVPEHNTFFAQTTTSRTPMRQSVVDVSGQDFLDLVEQYYRQSEQLPARLFRLGEDAYAMIVAQPDIDMPWFEALDEAKVRQLEEAEELRMLERREYRFACGCSLDTVLEVLVGAYGKDSEEIFAGDPKLEIRCPRCAGLFTIEPEMLARFLEDREPPASR